VKEGASKGFWSQPIWEGYSKPHSEIGLYTSVDRKGKFSLQK